jgi:hypothetical protein
VRQCPPGSGAFLNEAIRPAIRAVAEECGQFQAKIFSIELPSLDDEPFGQFRIEEM